MVAFMNVTIPLAACLLVVAVSAAASPLPPARYSVPRQIAADRQRPVLLAFVDESDSEAAGAVRDFVPSSVAVVRGLGTLTIEVRFDAGFDNSPEARAAFIRAVEIWCSLVEAPQPITLVLDVHYGPTVSGSTLPLGRASIQPLIGRGEYGAWRAALFDSAHSGRDLALFASLPEEAVPTDLGPTDTFVMPSAVLRVAGLLPSITDPEAEASLYGPPPSIEIINTAPWDFDPDDGIAPNSVDFVGVALHEIGHILGFTTRCGSTETNPSSPLTFSAFDVFRFRPGIDRANFTTAPRILTAGGEQVHFSNGPELALSTARLNLTGGDGFSGDHWKDDTLTGTRLGIMDPQQRLGLLLDVTANDVEALRAMGYRRVGAPRESAPFVTIDSELDGSILTLRGRIHDIEGDASSIRIMLLDSDGTLLHSELRDVELSGERIAPYEFTIAGLDDWPSAVTASVVARDSAGNESLATDSGFAEGDVDGPVVRSVTYNGRKLTIRGLHLDGVSVAVEINGIATPADGAVTRRKIRIRRPAGELGLNPGPNRIRVIRDGARSNAVVLDVR